MNSKRKTTRSGNHALALADALDRARVRARNIDSSLAGRLARLQEHAGRFGTFGNISPDALNETREFADLLASDLAHIRNVELADARELALVRGRKRLESIDNSFDFDDRFLYALGSRHGGPSRHTPGLVGDRVRAYNDVLSRVAAFDALAHELDIAYTNARALGEAPAADADALRARSTDARDNESGKYRQAGRVAPPARRLVVAAAGLLPREDQARYREEWQGELDGLAEAGTGRWRQVRHSLRLMARTPLLRIELRAVRHRRVIL